MAPRAEKPQPTPDIRLVFHPEEDATYQHFAGGADPFDAGAARVGRLNAWWLAEAALLTYHDPASAVPVFERSGLTARLFEAGDLQCYVAHTDSATIVAFRGTEPDSLGDIVDDALFSMVAWHRPNTFVHRGFKAALDRVWSTLQRELDRLAAGRTIWFTGHSLGAALATLAADRCAETAGVCTLGSPLVGDRGFAAAFNRRFGSRSLRYVHDADVVTWVPPAIPFLYEHVGEARYIDAAGAVHTNRPPMKIDVPRALETLRHVHEHTASGHAPPPGFLLDHMPRAYTVAIWNDYVRHGD